MGVICMYGCAFLNAVRAHMFGATDIRMSPSRTDWLVARATCRDVASTSWGIRARVTRSSVQVFSKYQNRSHAHVHIHIFTYMMHIIIGHKFRHDTL
jgi:hypothetical protein